ncbi:hypothetical protein BLD44_024690 [Mastigocladus laminosus UU774]|nr:hypothetical protein BLD44_024690 [Mastigocladus laminosus UU774]
MARLYKILGLTQNHEKTNREDASAASHRVGRKGHEEIRVWESFCVSPRFICIAINVKWYKS